MTGDAFRLLGRILLFVFGIVSCSQDEFVQVMEQPLSGVLKIPFGLRVAVVNKDYSSGYFHEFLVPELGHAAVVMLHDRLYAGRVREHIRLDIDFIPHFGDWQSRRRLEFQAPR